MKLLLILIIAPFSALSSDALHRSVVLNLALASSIDTRLQNIFWISNINVSLKSDEFFLNSSGVSIINVNKIVSSGYDSAVTYDISEFYKKSNNRIKVISNFILDKPNTIFSIGFDSGVIAEKIVVQQNLFLGITHAFKVKNKSYMVLSAGSWFGGGIKEYPCYDLFDREYWCQNLTAWSDYNPKYPKNYNYIDVKYIYKF